MKAWRHGGNVWEVAASLGCSVDDIIDFSSSINPFGPPGWVYSLIDSTKTAIRHYPDPFCVGLRDRIAQLYDISPSEVLPGNGTSELLYLLPRALDVSRVLIPVPSYVDYEYGAKAAQVPVFRIPMRAETDFKLPIEQIRAELKPGDMVYIGRPNNPTGVLCDSKEIRLLAQENKDACFVLDEAFYDFVQDKDPLVKNRPENVIVLFSLTKILAVPGIRIGWMVADSEITGKLGQVQPPWSVNVFAQAIGEKALDNRSAVEAVRERISNAREQLAKMVEELEGLYVYPSAANYLLVEVLKDGIDAYIVRKELLLRHRILIRTCDNFASLDEKFFRICVRSPKDNALLVEGLRQTMGS